ncbi:hypothetical protein BWQ96_09669 [Gracilariopsis chorda]|uniref:Uncharacterized protein n=1 Tax=Gracilariopsis chorda TaxID=448386 RepID=A0A2V3IF24_9FLOR|nr:hypothetical protein BWQ96_09669 [Gracilariopsis chorda]|eukprot:PXF40618.1 hypothetical protein BWQ96_09669 [Gracilariopsis chorda]
MAILQRNKCISDIAFRNNRDPGPLYLEFPSEIPDNRLKSDAMKAIETVLRLKPDAGWEEKRWNEIYNMDKKRGEHVLQETARKPELAVFSQVSNHWATRMLTQQRTYTIQKTTLKTNSNSKCKVGKKRNSSETDHHERNQTNIG